MARISINIIQEGQPAIVEEDIELATQHVGFGDEIEIIDQGDGCWTVDIYDRRTVPQERVEAFKNHLEDSTQAVVEVELVEDWPPRDWAYAAREVRY